MYLVRLSFRKIVPIYTLTKIHKNACLPGIVLLPAPGHLICLCVWLVEGKRGCSFLVVMFLVTSFLICHYLQCASTCFSIFKILSSVLLMYKSFLYRRIVIWGRSVTDIFSWSCISLQCACLFSVTSTSLLSRPWAFVTKPQILFSHRGFLSNLGPELQAFHPRSRSPSSSVDHVTIAHPVRSPASRSEWDSALGT